ncbi:AAA family ATPase [Azovibrio restrictus]|uniref:AAA family ATPase n=1 Tax=Azovibrio restrictus TaxID=146938 RepID=UPI0026F0AED9|nr:AAA family ATPase [Azovibrio restrictus]MDD3482748.1 AAA family ATPase [Azovibrio restrictus]
MTPTFTIPPIGDAEVVALPAQGSWPEAVHQFDEHSALAVRAALAAQRPLLIRGEPGVGKSQLARAAAVKLGWVLLSEVVHARSESQDLQWRYDAVGRLGDAQAIGAAKLDMAVARAELAQSHYVSPGPLWWAFDWDSALAQHDQATKQYSPPSLPPGQTRPTGCVVLIDEIDKAEAELPNGLLETMGNGGFAVPWLDQAVRSRADMPPPLVIITTNEERELPAAFVRRCMVLQLPQPDKDRLIERGRLHFADACSEEVYTKAAEQLLADRAEYERQGLPQPGQAEYLDTLRVLTQLWPNDHAAQLANLERIGQFTFHKHPLADDAY